jgi:hypothetical protein
VTEGGASADASSLRTPSRIVTPVCRPKYLTVSMGSAAPGSRSAEPREITRRTNPCKFRFWHQREVNACMSDVSCTLESGPELKVLIQLGDKTALPFASQGLTLISSAEEALQEPQSGGYSGLSA